MTYSQLLFADVRTKVEKRKHQLQEEMTNLISANFNVFTICLFLTSLDCSRMAFESWNEIYSSCNLIFSLSYLQFALEKKNLELYNSKKTISEKDLDSRASIIVVMTGIIFLNQRLILSSSSIK